MDQNDSPRVSGRRMSLAELRAAAAVAAVFFLRMLGLFMILPVLPLHAGRLAGATPLTAGIALGAYGVTQALMQIPFGALSDRYGRKRVITAGLLLFAAGSGIAGAADGIGGVILGRLLQGAGAVAAAAMALTADLTREEQRTKAMAMIGVSIGLAFMLAFVLGPLIDAAFGLAAVFWTGALLALVAVAVLHALVPDPGQTIADPDDRPRGAALAGVLRDRRLLRLDLGVLCLHAVLTACFVALPLVLRDGAGLPGARHWQVYLPVLVVSVLLILPLLRIADRGHGMPVAAAAVAVLAGSCATFALLPPALGTLAAALVLFFAAFNLLEALLPALVSRTAPRQARGTALGAFSTFQFLGAFAGGALGGFLHGAGGPGAVFTGAAVLCLVWLGVSVTGVRREAAER